MGTKTLALDNILSAVWFFSGKWSPKLKRNQSRDVLRHLLCRLHGASKGQLFHARIRASQESIAAELDLSRVWTCRLIGRLREAGWIHYDAVRQLDGHYEVGFFRPGRMLKRLLCILLGYRKPRHRVNGWLLSLPLPRTEEKKDLLRRQQREKKPPSEATLTRIPLLKDWLTRGKQAEGDGR